MLPALGQSLRNLLFPQDANTTAVQEINICGVIPDVLFCRWHQPPPDRPIRRLTITEAHVLALLEHAGGLCAEDIVRELFLDRRGLTEIQRRLCRWGLLTESEGGTLRIARTARTKQFELVAVEMKLDRWRDALSQAKAYLRFANSAYVVLDGARISSEAPISSEFRSHGVGLVLQYADRAKLIAKPRKRKIVPTAERFIALQKALLLSSSQPRDTAPLSVRIQPDLLVTQVSM